MPLNYSDWFSEGDIGLIFKLRSSALGAAPRMTNLEEGGPQIEKALLLELL